MSIPGKPFTPEALARLAEAIRNDPKLNGSWLPADAFLSATPARPAWQRNYEVPFQDPLSKPEVALHSAFLAHATKERWLRVDAIKDNIREVVTHTLSFFPPGVAAPGAHPPPTAPNPPPSVDVLTKVHAMLDEVAKDLLPGADPDFVILLLREKLKEITP